MAPPKVFAKPKSVADYIAAADPAARAKLRQIRQTLRTVAPKAVESLKWGMPTHSHKRIVMIYAAFKKHVSLFPGPTTLRAFKKELARHDTSGATIRFPLDRPLPLPLIRKLIRHRVKEILAQDGKWRTKT